MLDSAVASGLMAAKGLYVIHAAAGDGMDSSAAAVIKELAGDYAQMPAELLWYHGIWLAHLGDRSGLATVAEAAKRRAERLATPLDRSTAASMGARLAVLTGDTAQAIDLLRQVVPTGDVAHIEWGMQEPFGQEQLLLAELLLARGQAEEAIETAGHLDWPRPIIYLVFLRQSIELRIRAAEQLGRADLASAFGHGSRSSPSNGHHGQVHLQETREDAMPTKAIKKLGRQFKKKGRAGPDREECCRLVLAQLAEIAKWEKSVYDTIWGGGGGGTPPPPPKWPPA